LLRLRAVQVQLSRRFDDSEPIEPVEELSYEASRHCAECWSGGVREATIARRQQCHDEVRRQDAAREAALARAVDRNAALLLEREMSRISEAHYCAGWLVGLGGTLWAMTQDRASRMFGFGEVPNEDLDLLVELSARAGGRDVRVFSAGTWTVEHALDQYEVTSFWADGTWLWATARDRIVRRRLAR
jgi:hypothetical protein